MQKEILKQLVIIKVDLVQRTFPDPITDSCFVDVINVTLAVEENKSKHVNVVAELMLLVVLM